MQKKSVRKEEGQARAPSLQLPDWCAVAGIPASPSRPWRRPAPGHPPPLQEARACRLHGGAVDGPGSPAPGRDQDPPARWAATRHRAAFPRLPLPAARRRPTTLAGSEGAQLGRARRRQCHPAYLRPNPGTITPPVPPPPAPRHAHTRRPARSARRHRRAAASVHGNTRRCQAHCARRGLARALLGCVPRPVLPPPPGVGRPPGSQSLPACMSYGRAPLPSRSSAPRPPRPIHLTPRTSTTA